MDDNIGDKLRFWRRKLSFSQNELAHRSGVSPVTIGQIETGKRKARKQTLQKLLEGLGISEMQFLGSSREAIVEEAVTKEPSVESVHKEMVMTQPVEKNVPLMLSNLDLEIINRTLNLSFDGKISVLKYLKNLA
jgi:transcriptional regulator with XRE-family HTH domain